MIFANLSFLWYNIEYLNLQNLYVRRYVRLVISWQVWNAVRYKQYYHTKHISLHLITFRKLRLDRKIKSKSHFESCFCLFCQHSWVCMTNFSVNFLTKSTLFWYYRFIFQEISRWYWLLIKVHEKIHFSLFQSINVERIALKHESFNLRLLYFSRNRCVIHNNENTHIERK